MVADPAAYRGEGIGLKQELESHWQDPEIPESKEAEILQAVTSFFGHSLEHDIWLLVEQAEEHGLDLESGTRRPAILPGRVGLEKSR